MAVISSLAGVVTSPGEAGNYFPAGSASGAKSVGWGGIGGTSFIADPEHSLSIVLYTQVFDYYMCAPALRISFQRACYDAFPDLRAKMYVEKDEAAGQDANMIFLPVWD